MTTNSSSLLSCKVSTLRFIAATFESTSDQTSKLPQASLNPAPKNQSPSMAQDKKNGKLKRFSKIESSERNPNC